jgi:MFS family permease
MALLGCWRFLTGFGTGANFPLSVIIATEYAKPFLTLKAFDLDFVDVL